MPLNPPVHRHHLAQRKRQLGISVADLSRRSGVSVATVRRLLEGRIGDASFVNVAAVAEVLGSPLQFADRDPSEVRTVEAKRKAEQIARMVQGTSALEGQAVDANVYRQLIEKSVHELLAGSNRRLWAQ